MVDRQPSCSASTAAFRSELASCNSAITFLFPGSQKHAETQQPTPACAEQLHSSSHHTIKNHILQEDQELHSLLRLEESIFSQQSPPQQHQRPPLQLHKTEQHTKRSAHQVTAVQIIKGVLLPLKQQHAATAHPKALQSG